MKTTFARLRQSAYAKSAAVGSALAVIGSQAHAVLPAEATAAMTALGTNTTDMLAIVWPVVSLSVGGFALIKLFRKGANKAV